MTVNFPSGLPATMTAVPKSTANDYFPSPAVNYSPNPVVNYSPNPVVNKGSDALAAQTKAAINMDKPAKSEVIGFMGDDFWVHSRDPVKGLITSDGKICGAAQKDVIKNTLNKFETIDTFAFGVNDGEKGNKNYIIGMCTPGSSEYFITTKEEFQKGNKTPAGTLNEDETLKSIIEKELDKYDSFIGASIFGS